jgi:arylsulfatase A-like enzyme
MIPPEISRSGFSPLSFPNTQTAGENRRPSGWILAGWVGVIVGVFDALAEFLHPVSRYVLPFSVSIYVVVSVVLFFLARGIGGVLEWVLPKHPRFWRAIRDLLGLSPAKEGEGPEPSGSSFPLSCLFALWVTFFGAYGVTTSTAPWLSSQAGAVVGSLLALAGGLAAFLLAGFLWRRAQALASAKPRLRRLASFSPPLLLLLLLVYPVILLFFLPSKHPYVSAAGEEPPRGFILISLDAARGDRLSGLGYPRPTTPEVDRLIRGGTAFSRAYIQEPASGPGHACMLTGLPPLTHGVVANAHTLGDSVLTLAERLKAGGFQTAAFINNYYLESRFGFDQGFDCFINQYRAARLNSWQPSLLLRGLSLFHFLHRVYYPPGHRTSDTIQLTLDWLRHLPGGDFFVFLHIMDPHAPYDPPPDLRDRFYLPEGQPVRDTAELRQRIKNLSEAEVEALRDLYDADVALADRKVGRLVRELRRLNLLSSTLIVVTADHGEVLYEKEQLFDHGSMWTGNLHVPLVFHYPRKVPKGIVCDRPVPAAALVATSLALLGFPYADQTTVGFYSPLLGQDGSVQLQGSPFVFTLGLVNQVEGAVTGERYKVIVREARITDLYDLGLDPQEQRNLWPEVQAAGEQDPAFSVAQEMLEGFLDWMELTREVSVGLRDQTWAKVDRETAKRLRALGY